MTGAFRECDLLVVGAGPGGCAAAIMARSFGHRVTLIQTDGSLPRRPGEALHPGILPLLEQLNVLKAIQQCGFETKAGVWREQSGRRWFEHTSQHEYPWQGFQTWRPEFDDVLLHRVIESGTEVSPTTRASDLVRENERVVGVKTTTGTIRAKHVVDALGGDHWLANQLGLTTEKYSPKLTAHFGYLSRCDVPDDQLPLVRTDEDGWTCHAKIDTDLYHWTSVPLREIEDEPPESQEQLDVTWRRLEEPGGHGYFCVGDAACVLDPASSHGILRAIMSGMMVAKVVNQVSTDPDRELALIEGYNRWLHDWFIHDVTRLREVYGRLPNPPHWIRTLPDTDSHPASDED